MKRTLIATILAICLAPNTDGGGGSTPPATTPPASTSTRTRKKPEPIDIEALCAKTPSSKGEAITLLGELGAAHKTITADHDTARAAVSNASAKLKRLEAKIGETSSKVSA